ncbi:hypothetical protein SDC9_61788 [bioreactor metagenome]|uniref:Radical SAM core domain-containing protein n=1 Tax=bioreactor metagenome TaxID=1076179 RepID=A0A644XHI9_9ZZZZ
MTPFYEIGINLAKNIHKISKAKLIIGGYHITALPETLEKPFEIGILGEREEILTEIVKNYINKPDQEKVWLSETKGISYFDKNGKVKINQRSSLVDVNKIPITDWSVFDKERIVQTINMPVNGNFKPKKVGIIYTSRGCPYSCSFCAHRIMQNNIRGVRYFPIERVLKEIKILYEKYKVECLMVYDDTFVSSKARIKQLIEGLKKYNLLGKICFFNLFTRANLVDKELVELLKELNTSTVFIGIESGSEKILKSLKDGPIGLPNMKRSIKLLAKEKIYVTGSFMIFSPSEKKEDLNKSVKLAKWFCNQRNAYSLSYSITTPYPGTTMWDDLIKKHKKTNHDWSDFVMFYAFDRKKMPKIFFPPKDVSKKETKEYWLRFGELQSYLNQKNIKIEESKIHQKEFVDRINRFIKNPKKTFLKTIKNKSIVGYILEDIKIMIKAKLS